jgi:hypothetical protein
LLGISVAEAPEWLERSETHRESRRRRKVYERHKFPQPGVEPQIPEDVADRWARLRSLFAGDFEFEARYPEAFELLVDEDAGAGLPLPSLGRYALPISGRGNHFLTVQWGGE